jgi:hypothetical protein
VVKFFTRITSQFPLKEPNGHSVQQTNMKTDILLLIFTLCLLSACFKRRPPVMERPPGPSSTITRQDIIDTGGHCDGVYCTDSHGRMWDCSNPNACSFVRGE